MEQELLCSLINYPEEIVDVCEKVPELAFKNDLNRTLYLGILKMFKAGKAINEATVFGECKDESLKPHIVTVISQIPSRSNIKYWASKLEEQYYKDFVRKKLEKTLDNLNNIMLVDSLCDLVEIGTTEYVKGAKSYKIKDCVDRFDEQIERNIKTGLGLETGFMCFDDKYIKYAQAHVWVVGAFTSTGKTSLMIEMAHRLYENNQNPTSLVISTEMTDIQNISRMAARITKLNAKYIETGKYSPFDAEIIAQAKEQIRAQNITLIDDVYDIDKIVNEIIKADIKGGVDVVFIDYAQNISTSFDSEYKANDHIAKSLQRVAKKCRCTIVLFSQLSNDAAKDDLGILQFKGAGTYSAVADLGIILQKSKEIEGGIAMDGRKNRHGQLFTQALQFEDGYTRLKEIHHEVNK